MTGLHEHVWVFDFKSLYPSLIRTFNIDPLSYVADPSPDADLIRTPAGAFGREPAILPGMLDDLFPRRETAILNGDAVASHAIKILMNSFYGVLGTSACRFYNPALANSITGMGKEILLWSKRWFEAAGFRVLYGDTDSLFVQSLGGDPVQTREQGQRLATSLNSDLAAYVHERWRVPSRLELRCEKLYLKLFLPHSRNSTRGASKRYVGLRHGDSPDQVEFIGMEVVRRDWTALAKQVQRELYQRALFNGLTVGRQCLSRGCRQRSGRSGRASSMNAAAVYRQRPAARRRLNTPRRPHRMWSPHENRRFPQGA